MKNGITNLKFNSVDKYKPGDILISNKLIRERVKEVALEIADIYKGKQIIVVGVLKGAYRLTTDLTEELHILGLTNLTLAFITVKSYPTGTVSQNAAKIIQALDVDPKNKNILIIEDIIDTGRSLNLIKSIIEKGKPKSVKSFALIDKPSRRTVKCSADYIGFEIPNIWVQGYGMDTDEIGRAEPNIIVGPHKYKGFV